MKVVPPIDISTSIITAHNVPLSPNPVGSATTAYTIASKVTIGQYDYEALVANTNRNQETDTATPSAWLNLDPSNRWAMFNNRSGKTWLIGTKTTNPNTIDITFTPGRAINSIGLVGVVADKVTVQMIVGGVVIDTRELVMSSKVASNWYEYFYGDFVTRSNLAYTDLPSYSNASIRAIVDNTGEVAEVGMMILGQQNNIGWAIRGTSVGLESYSISDVNYFGNVTQLERGSRDTIDYSCRNYNVQVGNVKRILKPPKDKAAMYIGSEIIDPTIVIGKLEDFNLTFANVTLVEYSLSVLSLE